MFRAQNSQSFFPSRTDILRRKNRTSLQHTHRQTHTHTKEAAGATIPTFSHHDFAFPPNLMGGMTDLNPEVRYHQSAQRCWGKQIWQFCKNSNIALPYGPAINSTSRYLPKRTDSRDLKHYSH